MNANLRRAILPQLLSLAFSVSGPTPALAQTQQPGGEPAPPTAAPTASFAVSPGTRFLVGLQDELSTGRQEDNQRFKVKTLEPLEAANGIVLRPGAEIRGHVSRIEPAAVAGHARLWLTFDAIRTQYGDLPIVAEVVSVPGDHSVKAEAIQEGTIEGRGSTQKAAAEAAAAGAAIGAVKGVKDKNKKEAGEGAVAGAVAAYLMESGRGHEIRLPKGAKLELELERPLYLEKQ